MITRNQSASFCNFRKVTWIYGHHHLQHCIAAQCPSVSPFIQSIYTSCTDSMNVCFNSFVWIYPNSHLIYLCAFYFYLREQKNRNKIIFAIINSIFNRQHSIGYDDDWFYVENNLEAITINTSQIKKNGQRTKNGVFNDKKICIQK